MSLSDLRRHAVARSLFPPTTLEHAIDTLGFVQADPIRAPARAQDLTLRHRVKDYRAGDLELGYATIGVEEDTFINYGFVSSAVYALMHPRTFKPDWSLSQRKRVDALLQYVGERGSVHPREVHAQFSHGRVTNYWGGNSNATTHLMDAMHYRGLLRVARREAGVRIYACRNATFSGPRADERSAGLSSLRSAPAIPRASAWQAGPRSEGRSATLLGSREKLDALVDVLVRKYAPLPGPSLSNVVGRLRYAVPQWRRELRIALQRARQRLSHAHVENVDWYWPADEDPRNCEPHDDVRLLAPFDPVVWDRRRFELLWGWAYRFEAYTPAARRQRGYYALPLLWRDRVIGWGNLSVKNGELQSEFGYVAGRPPRTRIFERELEAELDRVKAFLCMGK